MPEEQEPQPRGLTYKEVERAFDGDDAGAREAWRKICNTVGAGNVSPSDTATISLTGVAASKVKRVDSILAKAEEAEAEAEVVGAPAAATGSAAPAKPVVSAPTSPAAPAGTTANNPTAGGNE